MLRIARRGDRHDPRDLNVAVRLEGAYDAAFLEGRQDGVIPGETLKNIVHASARAHGASEIEELGLALSRQIVERQPQISRVRVEIAEKRWQRLEAGGKPQTQAFLAGSDEQRLAIVTTNGHQTSVVAGLASLTVMRTAGFTSGAAPTEEDGTSDGEQPLVVGTLSARWTYTTGDVTFGVYRQGVRAAVLDTFAWHRSQSVHHALHAVADVVLSTYEEIADVTLAFHERPYRPADLFAAGSENHNELFVVVDEPIGVVEVTVERNR
jgi:urate oxidase